MIFSHLFTFFPHSLTMWTTKCEQRNYCIHKSTVIIRYTVCNQRDMKKQYEEQFAVAWLLTIYVSLFKTYVSLLVKCIMVNNATISIEHIHRCTHIIIFILDTQLAQCKGCSPSHLCYQFFRLFQLNPFLCWHSEIFLIRGITIIA